MARRIFALFATALLLQGLAHADYVDLVSNDPGLVSYWRFEEPIAQGVVAVDSNKDANPGVYADGISVEPNGIVGQAALFSGDDGAVITIDNEQNFDFEETLSVEAWFRTGEFTRGWQSLIGKGDDQWRLHRGCTDGCTELKFGTEDGSAPADTPDTFVEVDDDMWHHIVAVFDGNDDLEGPDGASKYMYLDGELYVEQVIVGVLRNDDSPTQPNPIDLPVMIGGNSEYPDDGFRAWNGWIDEVAVYSRALSEQDVMDHFLANKSAGPAGDFDGDGDLDGDDIDALSAAVRAADGAAKFDLNADGAVDNADRLVWVADLKKTWIGDSNLDGEFNSSDFVAVFTVGKYEDGVAGNAGWTEGDWNGDADFDSSDFVAAFSDGGFELGLRTEAAAVPEPASALLLVLGGLGCAMTGRRRS